MLRNQVVFAGVELELVCSMFIRMDIINQSMISTCFPSSAKTFYQELYFSVFWELDFTHQSFIFISTERWVLNIFARNCKTCTSIRHALGK